MAFRQVKELLQWVAEFHEKLAARYSHLAGEQSDERMKMTLDFFDRSRAAHASKHDEISRRCKARTAQYLVDRSSGFCSPSGAGPHSAL